jgi:hypothetical protein
LNNSIVINNREKNHHSIIHSFTIHNSPFTIHNSPFIAKKKSKNRKKSSSHNHISFSPLSSATSLAHHELDAVAAQIILETWFAQCL